MMVYFQPQIYQILIEKQQRIALPIQMDRYL